MNITGIALNLAGNKIVGAVQAITTELQDALHVVIPLAGFDLCDWAGTVQCKVLSTWAWTIGAMDAGDEFAIVVPPPSDHDGDGDVDSADVGILLSLISAGGTNGGKIGTVLADFGNEKQTMAKVGLYGSGAGNGIPKTTFAGGTFTPYTGDGAVFVIHIPVTAEQVGAQLTVTVDLKVK